MGCSFLVVQTMITEAVDKSAAQLSASRSTMRSSATADAAWPPCTLPAVTPRVQPNAPSKPHCAATPAVVPHPATAAFVDLTPVTPTTSAAVIHPAAAAAEFPTSPYPATPTAQTARATSINSVAGIAEPGTTTPAGVASAHSANVWTSKLTCECECIAAAAQHFRARTHDTIAEPAKHDACTFVKHAAGVRTTLRNAACAGTLKRAAHGMDWSAVRNGAAVWDVAWAAAECSFAVSDCAIVNTSKTLDAVVINALLQHLAAAKRLVLIRHAAAAGAASAGAAGRTALCGVAIRSVSAAADQIGAASQKFIITVSLTNALTAEAVLVVAANILNCTVKFPDASHSVFDAASAAQAEAA